MDALYLVNGAAPTDLAHRPALLAPIHVRGGQVLNARYHESRKQSRSSR